MNDADSMIACLSAIGDADIDIVPIVFERFFATYPQHRAEFINIEAASGRMTNETIEALVGLATDEYWVPTTIINFVDLHRNYGSYNASLYAAWIDIVIDVVRESTGDNWHPSHEAAWQRQAKRLVTMIDKACLR